MLPEDVTPSPASPTPTYEGPLLPGRGYPQLTTVADALGAGDEVEALTMLFHDLALSGHSVPELVASAAYSATERLPRGMSLTDQRPGCWESALFESMVPADAADRGPGASPDDLECPTCYAPAAHACWTTDGEAEGVVAALTHAEVLDRLAVEGYDASDYSEAEARADLTGVLEYADRADFHADRVAAAADAVCVAGEWTPGMGW